MGTRKSWRLRASERVPYRCVPAELRGQRILILLGRRHDLSRCCARGLRQEERERGRLLPDHILLSSLPFSVLLSFVRSGVTLLRSVFRTTLVVLSRNRGRVDALGRLRAGALSSPSVPRRSLYPLPPTLPRRSTILGALPSLHSD